MPAETVLLPGDHVIPFPLIPESPLQLGHDLLDTDYPPEARPLGRTLIRWRREIAEWHVTRVSNGPKRSAT